jgi:hypothetical protein
LSVWRTKVFRSLIAYKTFYRLDLAQNFSYLALLATQGCRRAFQNTVYDPYTERMLTPEKSKQAVFGIFPIKRQVSSI